MVMTQEIRDMWSQMEVQEKRTCIMLGVGLGCILTGLGISWGAGAVFIGLGVFLVALGFNYL